MKRREIIRLIGSAPAALLLRKTLDVSTSRARRRTPRDVVARLRAGAGQREARRSGVRDGDAVIGIHPFLIGMPDGAADTDAILKAARLK